MRLHNSTSEPTASRHLPVEVLRRYVAGTLEPAEQHRVEAHTLDCAHCADMLEGLALQPAAVTDASLAELRQRLGARVTELAAEAEPEGAAVWQWRKLAAAAVLLLSLGVVAWFTLHRSSFSNNEALASREVRVQTPASVPAAPPSILPAAPAAEATPPTPEVAMNQSGAGRKKPTRPLARVRAMRPVTDADQEIALAGTADVSPVMEAASRRSAEALVIKDSVVNSRVPAAVASAPTPAAAMGMAAAPAATRAARAKTRAVNPEATRTIRGRVTDAAGVPLAGAFITFPGASTGVSTNSEGYFSLKALPAEQLYISSIGYVTQVRTIRPTDSTLTLALAPDTKALSEVVVVRRDAPPAPMAVGAMPAGGYAGLKKYLRDSLAYPEKALEDRREGNVKLRFVVGPDGKLSDIKVVKKLSEECDAEAIRLLQEGPAWFPAIQNGRRTARTVEITVPFKIEER